MENFHNEVRVKKANVFPIYIIMIHQWHLYGQGSKLQPAGSKCNNCELTFGDQKFNAE